MVQINPTNPSDSTNVANTRLDAGSLPPRANESKADSVFSQAGYNHSVYVEGNDAKYSNKMLVEGKMNEPEVLVDRNDAKYGNKVLVEGDDGTYIDVSQPVPKEPESKPGLLQRVMNFFFGD